MFVFNLLAVQSFFYSLYTDMQSFGPNGWRIATIGPGHATAQLHFMTSTILSNRTPAISHDDFSWAADISPDTPYHNRLLQRAALHGHSRAIMLACPSPTSSHRPHGSRSHAVTLMADARVGHLVSIKFRVLKNEN